MTTYHDHSVHPGFQLFELANGFMKSQAIYAAARMEISDILKSGPKTVSEIAKSCGAKESTLYRLLRALASMGIYREKENNMFELTPMASAILSDVPGSLRSYLLLAGDRSWWLPWGKLTESVISGKSPFYDLFGMNYETYLENFPELAKSFNDCMTQAAFMNNQAIVESYDFSEFKNIVDVGGGHGSLIVAILAANPGPGGILFDLPHVINTATITDTKTSHRLKMKGGNFFEQVPANGDLYLLKQIVHDWNDDRSIKILNNCRRVLAKQGRILVIESIIKSGNEPNISKFFDLHMLVTSDGGMERTISQYEYLFKKAGLKINNIIPTSSSFSLIEGIKI